MIVMRSTVWMYVNLYIHKKTKGLTFKLFYLMRVESCFLVEPIVGVFILQHPVEARFGGTSVTQSKTEPQSGSHI